MSFEIVIQRLQVGPAVLFIGQDYLSMESGKDHILEKVSAKYANGNVPGDEGYELFTKLKLSREDPGFSQWMQSLCKSISVPSWLEDIARFPWSAVYTTSYDTVLQRAFESQSRTVQPVVNEKYPVNDPRNKQRLHLSYLLGYIAAQDFADRPAMNILEKNRRINVYNALLHRLPNIITPKGILVIDGYSLKDQLPIEALYSQASELGHQQVLICNASAELESDLMVDDLIKRDIAVVTASPFAELLSQWTTSGSISFDNASAEDPYGKWLTIEQERIRLPQELINKVSRSAFIPDDSTFYSNPFKSEEAKYNEFRRFLSGSNVLPDWEGYTQGFAFKRDYYEKLKQEVVRLYQAKGKPQAPVVLIGQTSSGKTVSLGLLAYELREEYHYPVLFIPKRYQRPDENMIDDFCYWAEENGAKNTVIIWDGMLDLDPYYKLLYALNSRGRNVILVCTRYLTVKDQDQNYGQAANRNFIKAPIVLGKAEQGRFLDYLNAIAPGLARVIRSQEEDNLLALLYRFLPTDKSKISLGIHDEYQFFTQLLGSVRDIPAANKTQLYDQLIAKGIIDVEEDGEYLNKKFVLGSEVISIADFLIFSVMVAGQFGLRVPFELLLDAVGYDAFGKHIFKALNQVDLIRWFEDVSGNIELGPRTTLEATLLSRYAGGKQAESDYIILLLKKIRTEQGIYFGGFDRQVEFAAHLLYEMGPNASEAYIRSYYEITKVLRELRESRAAYHPRLVLKEALFLRAVVKNRQRIEDVEESDVDLLHRAESIVADVLTEVGEHSDRPIASYLRVELSTVCGFLAKQYIDGGQTERAKYYFYEVKRLNNHSFVTNPSNFMSLDIAYWTTKDMIEGNMLTLQERIDAESDLLSLIEMVEAEEVSAEHQEDFERIKYKFYTLIGKEVFAEQVFEKMKAQGYTAAIYLRARQKLGFDVNQGITTEVEVAKNSEAFDFLQKNMDTIRTDGRCLFLMLKTWWMRTAGHGFFDHEKQTLAFSDADWDFCLHLTDLLFATDEKFLSGTAYYVRALAQFHSGLISRALETFDNLQEQSYRAYGRKRVSRYYLFATEKGVPKTFSGSVRNSVSRSKRDSKGELYISELNLYVPFFLYEFGQVSFRKEDRITNVQIAFNFLGPIALPAKN